MNIKNAVQNLESCCHNAINSILG